jgi:Flp pilus assembly protein TadD
VRDADVVAALDRVRLRQADAKDGDFDTLSADDGYAEAFRRYGVDVDGPDRGEAAIRVQGSAVRDHLLAALDHWWTVRRGKQDREGTSRVRLVADQADGDEWRARLRAAIAADDLAQLRGLADQADGQPPAVQVVLAKALRARGAVREAEVMLRRGLAGHPADFWLAHELGILVYLGKRWGEAEGFFRVALGLRPDSPVVWLNLGAALHQQGKADEAVASYRRAIELDPNLARAHNNLGNVLLGQGKLEEALACFHQAIQLDPKYAMPHTNLGLALENQGKPDEAVACFRKAVQLDPELVSAHYNLGTALRRQGKVEEAVASLRRAIKQDPKYAEAHCNLGIALRDLGRFREALAALEQGHELGSRSPGWRYPSDRWVRECRRMVELDARLPGLLAGTDRPADDAERLGFARLCSLKQQFATAAGLYAEAFAAQPRLAADLRAGDRYNAACTAAQAGRGRGAEEPRLSAGERLRWRRQALTWLRDDLAARQSQLVANPSADPAVAWTLQHWQTDPDLVGLRNPAELAKLSAEERPACERLWADVAALLRQAQDRK